MTRSCSTASCRQLNASIAGFKKGLAESGFVEGKDVVFTESHTNFDATLVPQMIEKLKAENPKLIYTVTTPEYRSR